MEVTLHKHQREALFSETKTTVLVSGIQGGKTFIGGLWSRYKASQFKDPQDCGLVTAPTYKILKQATLPRFLSVFNGLGEWVERDSLFQMHTGQKIYVRTMHEPNAIEGIARCRWVWGDEAGQYKQLAWVNIEGRAAPMQAPIFLTTTPYALNWLYKDLYKPWRSGKNRHVHFVQFRSVDNPYFPKNEYERLKETLDPRDFARKYEGRFEKMAGLVFMDFDELENMTEPHEHWRDKSRYFVCAGVDWGFTNPFAISVRAIHKHEPRDYQIGEFYQSYLTPSDKIQIAKQYQARFGIEQFFCDNEEPAMIEEFNRAGLKAIAAPKYPGSLKDNISTHNGIIKSRVHKVFRGVCPHTEEEYETYHYKEEESDKDENLKEEPVDCDNHLMTANMYVTQCTTHIRRSVDEKLRQPTEPTHFQRLQRREFAKVPVNDWYDR